MSMFTNPANQQIMSAVDFLASQAAQERSQQKRYDQQIQMMNKRDDLFNTRLDKERDYNEKREAERIRAGNIAMAKNVEANTGQYSKGTQSLAESILSGKMFTESGRGMFAPDKYKEPEQKFTHKDYPGRTFTWDELIDINKGKETKRHNIAMENKDGKGKGSNFFFFGGKKIDANPYLGNLDAAIKNSQKVMSKGTPKNKTELGADGSFSQSTEIVGDNRRRVQQYVNKLETVRNKVTSGQKLTEKEYEILKNPQSYVPIDAAGQKKIDKFDKLIKDIDESIKGLAD